MASTSENTFGAKLRNAQDLLNYIQGFTGYAPPRTQESVASMTTLITSIVTANTTTANNQQQYKAATAARQAAYKGTNGSIEKLLPSIKGAVEAQFGKKAPETESIGAQIKTMRSNKLVKSPADPTKLTQEKPLVNPNGHTVQWCNRSITSSHRFNNLADTTHQMSI